MEKQLRRRMSTKGGWFFAWLLDGAGAETDALRGYPGTGPVHAEQGFGRGYQKQIAAVWR